MELTVQAARSQRVELTSAQQKRLEKIAAQPHADLEQYKQLGQKHEHRHRDHCNAVRE